MGLGGRATNTQNQRKNEEDLLHITRGEKHMNELLAKLNEHDETIKNLFTIIHQQQQRINALTDALYRIAPELEIIEAISDTPEQQQFLIERYMNHGRYST